ncbi:hypothetical protein [Streptomyces cinereoruber]|uniref:hypothetical protein n=1 Tax=Streptomyces cinereoruber TaxID=67260 RepID=UPI003C2C0998
MHELIAYLEGKMPEQGIAPTLQSYRTHYALHAAIGSLRGEIEHKVSAKGIDHALRKSDWDLARAHAIERDWNRLISIARMWEEDKDFDHERWVYREARDTEKEGAPAAGEKAPEPAVSEYRIPRARDGAAEDIVVARSGEQLDSWGVFEGSTQGWHWDGTSWQHPSLTGSSPYRYTEQDALDAARRCATAPHKKEGTGH